MDTTIDLGHQLYFHHRFIFKFLSPKWSRDPTAIPESGKWGIWFVVDELDVLVMFCFLEISLSILSLFLVDLFGLIMTTLAVVKKALRQKNAVCPKFLCQHQKNLCVNATA